MFPFRSISLFARPAAALAAAAVLTVAARPAQADGFLEFGDEDRLNSGAYSSEPKAGATLFGLSSGMVTFATNTYNNDFPFSPAAGDFAGTDTIYVGSNQTGSFDGYAGYNGRVQGPLVLTLNYSSLIPVGQSVATLTLGLAISDFQQPSFRQPYTATINGVAQTVLTNQLNTVDQTGPRVQFFSIGLSPTLDNTNHTLTVSIDEGGNGGDGFAIDFATVGVTTQAATAAPEPGTFPLIGFTLLVGTELYRRRRASRRR